MNELTEDDAQAMRKQGDLGPFIVRGMREAAAVNETRRRAVLRYPDIAARLTEQPLNYASPEQWGGFIPPNTTATGAINPSPIRVALLRIVYDAEQRANQPRQATA